MQEGNAHEDRGGLQNPCCDETEREGFVLLLEDGEEDHGRGDAGQRNRDLQEATDDGGGVRRRAEDVVRALYRVVEEQGRDGHEREDIEDARGARELPVRRVCSAAHRGSRGYAHPRVNRKSRFGGRPSAGHFS